MNIFKRNPPQILNVVDKEKPPLQPPEPTPTTKDLAEGLSTLYESILIVNQNQLVIQNMVAELRERLDSKK